MTSHQRTDGIQEDYCDSAHFQENPLFSVDCNSLQLMLYYDDLEFCNPLGSKRKKHKLGWCMACSFGLWGRDDHCSVLFFCTKDASTSHWEIFIRSTDLL